MRNLARQTIASSHSHPTLLDISDRLDLNDKVIFIGRFEHLRPDKQDDFHPEDGTSRFYLDWFETYERNPPGDSRDGGVRLATK